MDSKEMKESIEKYIEAYNSFDTEGMVSLLHEDVRFRNITDGVTTMETAGIQAFRELTEQSATMFISRRQTITEYRGLGDTAEAAIDYVGVLAVDFPNGLKKGDTLRLRGKSKFEFKDGKIALDRGL